MTFRLIIAVMFLLGGAIGLKRAFAISRGGRRGSATLLLITSCIALTGGMVLAIAPRAGSLTGIVLSFVQNHQLGVVVVLGGLLVGLLWQVWHVR